MAAASMAVNHRQMNIHRSFPSFLRAHLNPQHAAFVTIAGPTVQTIPRTHPHIMAHRPSFPSAFAGLPLHHNHSGSFSCSNPHHHDTEYTHTTDTYPYDQKAFSAMGKHDSTLPLIAQAMPTIPAYFPFRPAATGTAVPASAVDAAWSGGGTNPLLPTPKVLSGEVDASQYEHVPFGDWVRAPADYSESPPSEADSPESLQQSPATREVEYLAADTRRTTQASNFDHVQPFSPRALQRELEHMFRLGPPSPDPYNPRNLHVPTPSQANFDPPLFVLPAHTRLHQVEADPTFTEPTPFERPASSSSGQSAVTHSTAEYRSQAENIPADRQSRNDWLLEMRDRGYSYKDIKRIGGFSEAESTLRGRIRMLTKDKSERVRKPVWTANDVNLLRRGVRHFGGGSTAVPGVRKRGKKMPWKKVGEWMSAHGSSYDFAPATCAKKWEEVS